MKTLAIVFTLTLISVNAYSQYSLTPAFPNLGTFNTPTEIVNAGDGTNRLFVSEITGKIFVFYNLPTVSTKKTFLDMSSLLTGADGALLGLAFHPDYRNNRYFYVHYIFDSAGVFYLRLTRFTTSSNNPDSASISSRLNLLTFSEPQSYHPGGKIQFGPDGYLYASFGDGGVGGSLAQDNSLLAGKVTRINVDSAAPGKNYSIPVSNPYYGNIQGYREEIYATGFRNLWRFSFDVPTNRLWGADVGENSYEEIDIIQNGKNYGWNKMEGFHCFGSCDTTGKGFTRPIYEYSHNGGSNSITGGYVYRGSLRPELYGKYIYSDYINGTIYALTWDGINPPTNSVLLTSITSATTFGLDENNEIYFSDYSMGIFKFYPINVMAFNLKACIEGFYNAAQNRLNIRDTINTFLKNTTSPYNSVDSAKIVIDSLKLEGLGFFNHAANGNYYIVLRHRNGLQTWSKPGGVTFTKGSTMNYDFTSSASQAYGNNLKLVGTKYCIYSGDVQSSGFIDVVDITSIYNKSLVFASGEYLPENLNCDQIVDAADMVICYNNSKLIVGVITP